MLLSAENISKNYGTKQLLQNVSLYLDQRERIGVIGANGTGKSTFLRILVGEETPDTGSVSVQRNARLAFLPQNPEYTGELSAIDQVFSGFSPEFREIKRYEVESILNRLGIADITAKMSTFSGGQRKRVALAAALIQPADILVLDEPTNHLDSDMVIWLEDRLSRFTGGLIMVTHDRYFLQRVVTRITELSHGKASDYSANYSQYLELRAQKLDMAVASERKRQAVLRTEREWIMRGAKARSTKAKGRIDRYNQLLQQEAPTEDDSLHMAAVSSRLGKKLIELKNVSKGFDGKPIIKDFSYILERSDRIGIVGKNGAGKSTLLNLFAGALEPDSGVVECGSTVRIGYFTQEGLELDNEVRVYDCVSQIASTLKTGEGVLSASQLLEQFLFDGELQRSPVGKLSGGERRRLQLLCILASAPNVLLLDEPTNDLDVDTLTVLEDYLHSFPGAVIAVSHDRYFLDKLAEKIFEPVDGRVNFYNGNFSDYLEKRDHDKTPNTKSKPGNEAQPSQKDLSPNGTSRQRPLKLTYNEQCELETIDAELAALEAEIAECDKESQLSASDYLRLIELDKKKQDLSEKLEEKIERWLYLNELLEKINSQHQP